MRKVRTGISFEPEVVSALDEQVESSSDLALNRSEITNAVIKAFFETGVDRTARTRELVIANRNARKIVGDRPLQGPGRLGPRRRTHEPRGARG